MADIREIHDKVFDQLKDWSQKARIKVDAVNPFFYMRSKRDQRFTEGYWFPGDENYLCVSFWSGGDSKNRTPNIYFEIRKNKSCRVIVTARDSKEKFDYLTRIVEEINHHDQNKGFVRKGKQLTWVKDYTRSIVDYHQRLNDFISSDKKIIDLFLKTNGPPVLDEYISPFEILTQKEFERMYNQVLTYRSRLTDIRVEKEKEELRKSNLKVCLSRIEIENFQGFKNERLEGIRLDSNWVFITGENGYGKSSLLKAIALGFYDDPILEQYLSEKTTIRIEAYRDNKQQYLTRTGRTLITDTDTKLRNYIIGYGPIRLNTESEGIGYSERHFDNNVLNLFETTTSLINLPQELFATKHIDRDVFTILEEAIRIATNGRIDEVKVIKREVLFVEKLETGEKLVPLTLAHLASGFRNIINIVGDIIIRFSKYQKPFSHKEFVGIVLIDELENHLHPILQREFPIALSQVFPKIQFIATTHSPIPLLGAPKNSTVIRVDRNRTDGTTLKLISEKIDFKNLLPNALLTSPIFGLEKLIENNFDDLAKLGVENTYGQKILFDSLMKHLQSVAEKNDIHIKDFLGD